MIAFLADAESHVSPLLVIGFAVFAGTIGARVFQRLRIPQVVGYIAIGLVLGDMGFGLIGADTIRQLGPFNFFALGVIGFMIGGELHRDELRKHGRQFLAILLAEGMGAYVLVGTLVTTVTWIATGNGMQAVALGLLLGAISSATAPAATVDVLWEYKSRGALTRTVFAIVALDDGLALVLYSISSALALRLMGAGSGSMLAGLGHAGYQLLGAVVVGAAAGFCLNFVIRLVRDRAKVLAFIVGMLALVLGLSLLLDVDLILSAMALGVTITNLAPRRTNEAFKIVENFTPPIYVLFFVFVGARLSFSAMPGWMLGIVAVYVVGRTAGKWLGAYGGARWTHAADGVRKYLGFCLFSQAGVAVGLSILAAENLSAIHGAEWLGQAILMIVTATTFVVQIIGPPSVKYAIQKAGEAGLDVTEEDLAQSYRVVDVMDEKPCAFRESTTVAEILRTVSDTDATTYPVIDSDGRLTGLISVQDLMRSFGARDLMDWLLAHDLMLPVADTVTSDTPLPEARLRMQEQGLSCLPVVRGEEDQTLAGMLDKDDLARRLSLEILRRRQLADGD